MTLNPFLKQIIRAQATGIPNESPFPNTKSVPGVETTTGLESFDGKQTDALFSEPDLAKYANRELTQKDLSELDENMRRLEGAMDNLDALGVSQDPKSMSFGQKVAYKMKMALQPGTKASRARLDRELRLAGLRKLSGDWIEYAKLKAQATGLSPYDEARSKAVGKAVGEAEGQAISINARQMIADELGLSDADRELMLRMDLDLPDAADPIEAAKKHVDVLKVLEGMAEFIDPEDLDRFGLSSHKDFVTSVKERKAAEKSAETAKEVAAAAPTAEKTWQSVVGLAVDYQNMSSSGNLQKFTVSGTDARGFSTEKEQLREVPTVTMDDAMRWSVQKHLETSPELADILSESKYGANAPEPEPSHDTINIDSVRARIKELQGG